MTPEQFIKAGRKLFGAKKWKTQLSRALGVNVSTIHRMTHRAGIPGPWAIAVNALLAQAKAQAALDRAARKLLPRKLRYKKTHRGKKLPPRRGRPRRVPAVVAPAEPIETHAEEPSCPTSN